MNYKKIAEKMIVTFLEAGIAFLALNNWDFGNKTIRAGAIGAGLSAMYNVYKQLRA